MNNIGVLNVKTCIDGLKWIVFEAVMQETFPYEDDKHAKLLSIREGSGIKDRLAPPEKNKNFDHMLVSRLLECLLYDDFVYTTSFGKKKTVWTVTIGGVVEYRSRTIENLGLDAYVNGLEEAVLNVLEATADTGMYMQLKDIASKTGIEDELVRVESQPLFTNGFTNTILMHLLLEKRVDRDPDRRGFWKITDSEMQRRLQ